LSVVALAAACTSTAETATDEVPAGDPATFCTRWPEARAYLSTSFEGSHPAEVRGEVERARNTLEEVGVAAPASLRSTWEKATRFQDTVITLLGVAYYEPERLRQELVDAAFGEGGVEAASAESAAAIERLDAWAVEECGDFCEWWPRLDRALTGVDERSMASSGAENEALLLGADALVPDAVRGDWDAAAAITLAIVDRYRAAGWAPPWASEVSGPGWVPDEFPAAVGVTEEQCEVLTVASEVCYQGSRELVDAVVTAYRDRIADWVESNCVGIGASGLPGRVTIGGPPTGVPGTLLMAAVPVGTDLSAIDDASAFLGVACSQQEHWSGQPWSAVLLDRERGFESPCTAPHMTIWGTGEALLPAGDYELFAGYFPAGVGRFDLYVPAPESCAVVPFTVDGDTELTLPELGPCDLGALAGSAEEIARRRPPAAPTDPTGTLRVVLIDYPREGEGFYRIVVLPHGTTLNEIALGEAWPAGSGCLYLQPLAGFGPDITAAIATGGVPIPILSFPAVPYEDCAGAPVYLGFEGDWTPEPIDLGAGEYDVYVVFQIYREDGEESRCGDLTVAVSGETVVEVPPLEECP
jgi:hypothetical protein